MITLTPHGGNAYSMPPPSVGNMAVPNSAGHRYPPPHQGQRFGPRHTFFQPFRPYVRGAAALDPEFDGKRLRKSAMRKTVDYNSAIIKTLEARVWQRDYRDRRALQPDVLYMPDLQPPPAYNDNAINAVTTRFVKAATNKMRCPIFCMAWTPEGRRLVTGASSGEFTLWNGLTFNFETILQAHDSPVRTMVWSHNDVWMVTADHAGYVKYWQSNMNNVKMFLAHKEAIRGISFSPSDSKFATCSDDGTIKIWDFQRCQEERTLRGHGADVKCVHWHPQKGLVISGSKDNQQPVKLWDPKTGQSLATLHAHKSTVMDVKWNNNGNWLVTASRDHLLKLFDLRNLSTEVQTFRGHKKESSSVAWHPYHEGLFCSGGSDGAILFWHVGADKEVGAIEQAHDSIVWTLAWHPLGHILCSGSNDHSSKFWTRNRPGDLMRDKYNLNTLPPNLSGLDENEIDDLSVIPGMGPEDKVEVINPASDSSGAIPGLDIDSTDDKVKVVLKKVPYSKPIPKNFQAHWNHAAVGDDDKDGFDTIELINQLIVNQPGVIPLAEIEPESLVIYGKQIDLKPTDDLTVAIKKGSDAFARYINSGAVEELNDLRAYMDFSDDESKSAAPTPAPDTENQDDSTSADREDSWQNSNRSEDTQQSHLQPPIGSQDQDMRHLMMQPPPSFQGLEEQRLRPPPTMPSSQQGDMFRSMGPPEMFRPPDNFRPGFQHDPQGQNRDFQRSMPSREFNRTPDLREDMYRGPGEPFRSEFGLRQRQSSFRGRNQGFINDQEDTRSSFPDDQDMRTSYGNGGYNEDDNGDGEQWNNEEGFRDNYDWNEEGMEDDEQMDEDYHNGDRRYQQQSYHDRGNKSPRGQRGYLRKVSSRRARGRRKREGGESRGGLRGGPRGGLRGGSRGESRGGGFRPRGRNLRR